MWELLKPALIIQQKIEEKERKERTQRISYLKVRRCKGSVVGTGWRAWLSWGRGGGEVSLLIQFQ